MTTTDFNKKHPVYPEQSSILSAIDYEIDNIELFIKKAASAILFVLFLIQSCLQLLLVIVYLIIGKGNKMKWRVLQLVVVIALGALMLWAVTSGWLA